uniref:Uncharacterized protein n=1 Tax=uncultured Candidatus Melainabacteria bacterium TaxID=2682970 RepID=A0A650ELM1_9BACT|nr:hypothetical protein Melaina855_2510 [uncultured Candidatus Melainabacteria bacterium]
MNLIDSTVFRQNVSSFSNWVDTTPVPQVINTVTYDLYESNNPLRRTFEKDDIHNKGLRIAANATTSVGAEIFSMFTNPYYLTHKITQVPVLYRSIVDAYKKVSSGN